VERRQEAEEAAIVERLIAVKSQRAREFEGEALAWGRKDVIHCLRLATGRKGQLLGRVEGQQAMIAGTLLPLTAGEVEGGVQAWKRSMRVCLVGAGAVRAARVELQRLRLKMPQEEG
jgi:hypothetical protein